LTRPCTHPRRTSSSRRWMILYAGAFCTPVSYTPGAGNHRKEMPANSHTPEVN
jgi:hypothetical protein